MPGSRPVTCLYFAAERAPIAEPLLVLDGDGTGPVNNLCFPTQVAPGYGPAGATLVSASVVGGAAGDAAEAALEAAVRKQMAGWFGDEVRGWRHLRTYHIRHAQPEQRPGALEPVERAVRLDERPLRLRRPPRHGVAPRRDALRPSRRRGGARPGPA